MKTFQKLHPIQPTDCAGTSRLSMMLVIIAIVLIGSAAYFFFLRPSAPPAPVLPIATPAAKQARPDSAREVITALKSTTPVDYASAYEQAGEFLDDGEYADAQLLYYFAARGGNGPAALALATMYDPVSFDSNTNLMDEPDMFQAYKWYRSALQSGEDAAAERLAALKTWAEQAASAGDQKADQLLLQWEQ